MSGTCEKAAIARIEAALARIEAASARISTSGDNGLAAKHAALREEVGATLKSLDSMIAELKS